MKINMDDLNVWFTFSTELHILIGVNVPILSFNPLLLANEYTLSGDCWNFFTIPKFSHFIGSNGNREWMSNHSQQLYMQCRCLKQSKILVEFKCNWTVRSINTKLICISVDCLVACKNFNRFRNAVKIDFP